LVNRNRNRYSIWEYFC